MQTVKPLTHADFQNTLEEFRPLIGNYRWMWPILRARSAQIGGYFPHKIHNMLRRFGNPRKPCFICEFPDGLRFLGDYRDVNSMAYAMSSNKTCTAVDSLTAVVGDRPGTFLDVGANMGLFAAGIARFLKGREEVVAFEPVPATVRRAAATFALNNLDNVRLFPAAVGDADGEIVFYDAPGCSEYASAVPTKQSINIDWTETRVPSLRLDTLLEQGCFEKVGFLKVDAEGYEPKVISGAERLIRRDQPPIVYEYNYSVAPTAGWTASDVALQIKQWGDYKFHIMLDEGIKEEFNPPQDVGGLVNIYCESQTCAKLAGTQKAP